MLLRCLCVYVISTMPEHGHKLLPGPGTGPLVFVVSVQFCQYKPFLLTLCSHPFISVRAGDWLSVSESVYWYLLLALGHEVQHYASSPISRVFSQQDRYIPLFLSPSIVSSFFFWCPPLPHCLSLHPSSRPMLIWTSSPSHVHDSMTSSHYTPERYPAGHICIDSAFTCVSDLHVCPPWLWLCQSFSLQGLFSWCISPRFTFQMLIPLNYFIFNNQMSKYSRFTSEVNIMKGGNCSSSMIFAT